MSADFSKKLESMKVFNWSRETPRDDKEFLDPNFIPDVRSLDELMRTVRGKSTENGRVETAASRVKPAK